MKRIEADFDSSANQTGLQHFHQVKQGVNPKGKTIYLYERIRSNGKTFGFEVFTPSVAKAGAIQKFPNGIVQTIAEDTEYYAGKSAFGRSAYSCVNMERAEVRFNQLMGVTSDVSVDFEPPTVEGDVSETSVAPHRGRGRPRINPTTLLIPVGEFSTNELAEFNKVGYPVAYVFLKGLKQSNLVKVVRSEKRNGAKRSTDIFAKTS